MTEINTKKEQTHEHEDAESDAPNNSTLINQFKFQCPLEDHEKQPLNLICINEECPHAGLVCANCLTDTHYDHLKHCLSLKIYLNDLKSSMSTTNAFKKQEEQLTSINARFEEIFHELKEAREEFEDCFNRLDATFKFFHDRLNQHMQQYDLEHLKEIVKKLEEKSYQSMPELQHSVHLLIDHTEYSEENPKHFQVMPVRDTILLLRKKYRDLSSGLLQLQKFLGPLVESLHNAPVFQEFAEEFHELSLDSFRSDRDQDLSEEDLDADKSGVESNEDHSASENKKTPEEVSGHVSRVFNEGDATDRVSLISSYRDIAESFFGFKKKKRAKTHSMPEGDLKIRKKLSQPLPGETRGKSNVLNSHAITEQPAGLDFLEEIPEKPVPVETIYHIDPKSGIDFDMTARLRQQELENFDPRKLRCDLQISEKSSCQVNTLIILHDNKTILTGNNRGQINSWDFNEGKLLKTVVTVDSQICGLLGLQDGERFVVSTTGGDLCIYDYFTEQCLYTLKSSKGSCITGLVYFEDFTTIASSGKEAMIEFWDINSGQEIAKIEKAHTEWIWSLVYLKDNESLVSSGGDGVVKIWNYKTQELVRILNDLGSFILCSVYIRQPKLLAFGDFNGIIKVLNAETGVLMYNLIGHKGRISSMTSLAEGEYLVSASEDKTLRVWGLRNGSHITKLSGHQNKVSTVVALEDQMSLVSNSWDKTIRIWTASAPTQLKSAMI